MNFVETWVSVDGVRPDEWLTPNESAVYHGLRNQKRRRDWLLGRCAAKALFQRFQGTPVNAIEVGNNPDGVPFAQRPDGASDELWSLSISHSGELGVAAASTERAPIGVDSERIEPRARAWRELSFRPAEIPGLQEGPALDDELTKLWTQKEAVLKFLGLGLSTDLKNVLVEDGEVLLFRAALDRFKELGSPTIRLESRKNDGFWITLASVEAPSQWNV